MKLVIDMNLSPSWCGFLMASGYEVIHWSSVGDVRTTDRLITAWAKANGYIVFTHDLDFMMFYRKAWVILFCKH